MVNEIKSKQGIYEVYRILSGGSADLSGAVQMSSDMLGKSVSGYLLADAPAPVQPSPGVTGYEDSIRDAEGNLFRALSAYLSDAPVIQAGNTAALVGTRNISLLVFYFREADIFEEVFKRTSYLAKSHRDKETRTHLLDVITMTRDDDSLFQPFLLEASSKLFAGLGSFTREVSAAYLHLLPSGILPPENRTYNKGEKFLQKGKVYELTGAVSETLEDVENGVNTSNWSEIDPIYYTDDKVEFVLMPEDWFNRNFIKPVDVAMFTALVYYVMSAWFELVYQEEAAAYRQKFELQRNEITQYLNAQNRPLVRRGRLF